MKKINQERKIGIDGSRGRVVEHLSLCLRNYPRLSNLKQQKCVCVYMYIDIDIYIYIYIYPMLLTRVTQSYSASKKKRKTQNLSGGSRRL